MSLNDEKYVTYQFKDIRYPVYGTGETAKQNALLEAFYRLYNLHDNIRPITDYTSDPTQTKRLATLLRQIEEYNEHGYTRLLSVVEDPAERKIIDTLANIYNTTGTDHTTGTDQVLLTGIVNIDKQILNKLSDDVLSIACQTNRLAREICNDDSFWLNRTLNYYGNALGPADKIREDYLSGRSWQQYYQDLSQFLREMRSSSQIHKFLKIKETIETGRVDLLLLYIDENLVDISGPQIAHWAMENGLTLLMERLIQKDILKSSLLNEASQWATTNNHIDIIRLLLSSIMFNPKTLDNYLAKWATTNDKTEIILLLLNHKDFDPSFQDNYLIKWAATKGYNNIVKRLIAELRVDSTVNHN